MNNKQKGESLLGALIGVLLMGLIALGVVYATLQSERGHRDTKVTGYVLAQMREILQSNFIKNLNIALDSKCNQEVAQALTLSKTDQGELKIGMQVTCTNESISINGVSTTITKTKLTTLNQDSSYFGGLLEVGN